MRVSNSETRNFALLPIFVFDDDYVPLSPIGSPVQTRKMTKDEQKAFGSSHSTSNSSSPGSFHAERHLPSLSESSEDSNESSVDLQLAKSIEKQTPRTTSSSYDEEPLNDDDRMSPEFHVLDITDLNDPGVRVLSKFSFRDPDNKFQLSIFGKKPSRIYSLIFNNHNVIENSG